MRDESARQRPGRLRTRAVCGRAGREAWRRSNRLARSDRSERGSTRGAPERCCTFRLERDGLVEIRSSVQDIGTGIRTVLAQVVAEELGLRPEDVSVRIGDTDFPLGPSSGGSKTTGSITPAARKAAYRVRQALFLAVAPELGAHPEELVVGQGPIFLRANPANGIG